MGILGYDAEWAKEIFEQFRNATNGNTDWVLANPEPLKFEIKRELEPLIMGSSTILPPIREHEIGILLYYAYTEQKGYFGYFPKDAQVPARLIPCTNGADYDAKGKRETGRSFSSIWGEDGHCTVIGF